MFARERDREQGPRQEEDGADQALPGRPPASPRSPQHNTLALSFVCCCQVYKELPDVLSCGEQRDGRGAAGQGLVGAVFLLPRSLLAVSLPRKHSVAPPTSRFAYDNIASFGVYPEIPASFGVYLTRCSSSSSSL